MNSKGQKAGANAVSCFKFEPQTWRRTLCKNCFKTREQHDATQESHDATNKDASLARNGSAKPLTPEPDETPKSPLETSGLAPRTGPERRVLKKNADSNNKHPTSVEQNTTTSTKSTEKKKTVKVEPDKLATKPAEKKPDTAETEDQRKARVPPSKSAEKKKDVKTPDTKKTVAEPKTAVAKSSVAARDEKFAGDDGPGKNKQPTGSGPGGVAARARDGENTSGDAVVGNRKAGGSGGVAGGGDTGTGPPQVLGVGQQAEISTDRTPRQTRQEHAAAAEVGSASGSPAGHATDVSTTREGAPSTKTASPSSPDDDRDRANNEKNRRSGDLRSAAEERRKEVNEIAAAVDDYDSPIIRAAREYIEDESSKTARSNGSGESDRRTALYYHNPISEQNVDLARLGVPSFGGGGDNADYQQLAKKELSLARRRRRRRQSADACSIKMDAPGMRMREDTMAEETRMLVENLRDKASFLEDRCERLDREKTALGELLATKKREYNRMEEHYTDKISDLEEKERRSTSEKNRLMDKLKLPESERASLKAEENEIAQLQRRLEEAERRCSEAVEDNLDLRQEVRDLHLEMEEMHDQFRDDEAIEFHEIQKELEAAAKNCRILQFKLRKAERRNEQLEADRNQYEKKLRQLESHFDNNDDMTRTRELEEELKMAKEVSVRLHTELEAVEEKRGRYEEELGRVNDMLTESENRRQLMIKEADALNKEIEILRKQCSTGDRKSALSPGKAPTLGKLKKESSIEYDIGQIMRDLSDSLERENDLKEQLKFAESEAKIMRKKLSDFEEENESLTLQLQKLSSAKRVTFGRKGVKTDSEEKHVVTESEHDLRLQMELAEQEGIVLRRKLDEMQSENEQLRSEVTQLIDKLQGKVKERPKLSPEDYNEDVIKAMAEGIDKLKMKLIRKDQEALGTRLTPEKGILKKSRSLEDYSGNATLQLLPSTEPADLKRQLITAQQDIQILREKLRGVSSGEPIFVSGRQIPAIKADDTALQNIELRDRVIGLEQENSLLKDKVRHLDERTSKMSKEVARTASRGESLEESFETRDLKDQLNLAESKTTTLRWKLSDLERENATLKQELELHKSSDSAKSSTDSHGMEGSSRQALKVKVCELENDKQDLVSVIRIREEENERLLAEINIYREDIDKMMDTFRHRETELIEEIESMQQKNNVLSNLLDLVTDRAESAQKELEKAAGKEGEERSPSVVSGISDVSSGSDDVFAAQSHRAEVMGEKVVVKDWQSQFLKRIECLERLLAEEKQKAEAAQKKAALKDSEQKAASDDKELKDKEKQIVQQELALCQRQLKEANEQIKDLNQRLADMRESQKKLKTDYDRLSKELEEEKKKKKSDDPAESKGKGGAASWRWEKQDLEKQLKEAKKKADDLHSELTRQQFKWKMAGDDIAKEKQRKEKMEKEIKDLKEKCEARKQELVEVTSKVEELLAKAGGKEKEWNTERTQLEDARKAAEKDAKQKSDVIQQKDNIIKQKDELIKKKDESLKERDKSLNDKTSLLQSKIDELAKNQKEINDIRTRLKEATAQMKEKDQKIKTLDNDLRKRDERIKEKDDVLGTINRRLDAKEVELKNMDKTYREITKKLKDKDRELEQLVQTANESEQKIVSLNEKVRELKVKMEMMTRDHSNETTSLKSKCEQFETDLKMLKKEKKALLNEQEKTKEKLKDKEEKWTKEKSKLELELKQAKGKMHSQDVAKTMRASDAVKTLAAEKEELVVEKHQLTDEVNKLKKELKDSNKQWKIEQEDLKKIIAEKSKLIEDNSAISGRLQTEINTLKSQLSSATSAGAKTTPIPVVHEKTGAGDNATWIAEKRNLLSRCEQLEGRVATEKAAAAELIETKLKNTRERLERAQQQASELKKENSAQMELLQSSRRTLSDLRKKYESNMKALQEEKDQSKEKAKEIIQKATEMSELQKAVDELKAKLSEWEVNHRDCKVTLAAVKKTQAKGKKTDDRMSAIRARFEKKKTGKEDTAAASEADVSDTTDEMEVSIKRLQEKYDELQKARKDNLEETERRRREWVKSTENYAQRTEKLERQLKDTRLADNANIDLKVQLQMAKEENQQETMRLRHQLQDAQQAQLKEKDTIADLLAEVKKLKAIVPMLEDTSDSITATTKQSDTRRTLKIETEKTANGGPKRRPKFTSDSEIGGDSEAKRAMEQALDHISRLLADYEKPTSGKSTRQSGAGSSFRRCLSSSEVETTPSSSVIRSDVLAVPTRVTPLSSQVGSLDRPSRSRPAARGKHAAPEVDEEAFRAAAHRSSFHMSGTQSAYTSRDSSPSKGYRPRKISPYPVAPPSMIITPSHTPKRSESVERTVLSSRDMSRLYEKLGEIETVHREEAIATERTSGVRVLRKSASVDQEPTGVHTHFTATPAHVSSLEQRTAKAYEDAPPSETLPASIRVGGLVITPGIEQFSKNVRGRQPDRITATPRGHSLSPGSARRKFYDSFDQPPSSAATTPTSSSIFSWRDGRGTNDVQRKNDEPMTPVSASPVTGASRIRRTLFGAKRSVSVDSSGVQSTIAQIGVRALFPGAPSSSFESADTPLTVRAGDTHRRAPSAGDISTSGRTKTEPVSTKHTSSSSQQTTSSTVPSSSSSSGSKSESSSKTQSKMSTGSSDKKGSKKDSSSKKDDASSGSTRRLPPVLARLAGLKGFDGKFK